ncbi:hypothetical protein WOA01_03335 [Methylocystis sp. IM2]|uniref:hypothetical protein n=1 Tax=Methylocystis sp. IM2 TaxID=3136563 RepID=UPI0030F71340
MTADDGDRLHDWHGDEMGVRMGAIALSAFSEAGDRGAEPNIVRNRFARGARRCLMSATTGLP